MKLRNSGVRLLARAPSCRGCCGPPDGPPDGPPLLLAVTGGGWEDEAGLLLPLELLAREAAPSLPSLVEGMGSLGWDWELESGTRTALQLDGWEEERLAGFTLPVDGGCMMEEVVVCSSTSGKLSSAAWMMPSTAKAR